MTNDQWWSLETHFCESRSRRFQISSRSRRLQVSRFWILQRNGLVKFLQSNNFCLLHLQVRNNQNRSEKCQKFENNPLRSDDIFLKFSKNYKFWRLESRSFNQVSVTTTSLLMIVLKVVMQSWQTKCPNGFSPILCDKVGLASTYCCLCGTLLLNMV